MSDLGWGATLGVPDSTPIDDALITRLLDYLEARLRKPTDQGGIDPSPGMFNPIFEQKLRDWRAGTEKDLRERWLGRPIGSLPPNPLDWGPNVRQPGSVADLITGGLVGEALAGAADIVGKGLILLAIGGVMILGVRLLFREPSLVVQRGGAA